MNGKGKCQLSIIMHNKALVRAPKQVVIITVKLKLYYCFDGADPISSSLFCNDNLSSFSSGRLVNILMR